MKTVAPVAVNLEPVANHWCLVGLLNVRRAFTPIVQAMKSANCHIGERWQMGASPAALAAELKIHFELTNLLDVLPDMVVELCEQPLAEGLIVKEKAAHIQGFLLLHD